MTDKKIPVSSKRYKRECRYKTGYEGRLEYRGEGRQEYRCKVAAILLLFVLTGMLAGCSGRMTPKRLLADMEENMQNVTSSANHVEVAIQMEDVLDMSSENLALLKEEADMIEGDVIMRYIRIFSDLSGQLKYAPQKRVLIEIALIKLCRPAMETTQDALTDRVAQLEKKVEEGVTVVAAAPAVQPASGSAPATPQKPKEPAQMPKAIPDDIRQVVKNWSSIVRELPGVTATYLRSAHLSLGGENKLMLVFDDDLAYTYVTEERRRTEITERISNRIGKEIEVVMQSNDSGRPFEENYIDLEQIVHMDIEVEDE